MTENKQINKMSKSIQKALHDHCIIREKSCNNCEFIRGI